jgi:hypothetical protein
VDQNLSAFHVLLHRPGLATRMLETPQPMNAVFVHKIWDLQAITYEGTLQRGATNVSRRPTPQQCVALQLPIDF